MGAEFRRVAVITHPQVQEGLPRAQMVAAFLQARGCEARAGLLYDEALRAWVQSGQVDLCVVLGGDGTILRSGHLCGPAEVPMLGINLGRFGFLLEVPWEAWREALGQVLRGEYWREERMMLQAALYRGGRPVQQWEVVNEVVVSRGEVVRPLRASAYVDGHLLAHFVADALIAATPTGSTAYALAAGGPILPPTLRNILLVPVAPHLSVDRAVVLHEGSVVRIVPHVEHQAVVSVDGQPPVRLQAGDEVLAQASQHTLTFLRLCGRDYFYRNLTSYMNWNPVTGARWPDDRSTSDLHRAS